MSIHKNWASLSAALAIMSSMAFGALAQDVDKDAEISFVDRAEYGAEYKLAAFASACAAPQVKQLLKSEPNLDLSSPTLTQSPVYYATIRLANTASNENQAEFLRCSDTIMSIVTDSRYDWKEVDGRTYTDLMYFFLWSATMPDSVLMNQFQVLYLNFYQGLSGFDINYRTAKTGPVAASTVLAVLARRHTGKGICAVRQAFPAIDLEERPDSSYLTALFHAIRGDKAENLRVLLGLGADYLTHLDGFPGWSAVDYAKDQNRPALETIIREYNSGTPHEVSCASL